MRQFIYSGVHNSAESRPRQEKRELLFHVIQIHFYKEARQTDAAVKFRGDRKIPLETRKSTDEEETNEPETEKGEARQ